MSKLLLFLRVLLLILLVLLLINLGFRILSIGIKFWYISIPLLALIYLLVSSYWTNKKRDADFLKTPFHPYKEVKPEKEPEVMDVNEPEETSEKDDKER